MSIKTELFPEAIRLADLAKLLGYSREHFHTIYKELGLIPLPGKWKTFAIVAVEKLFPHVDVRGGLAKLIAERMAKAQARRDDAKEAAGAAAIPSWARDDDEEKQQRIAAMTPEERLEDLDRTIFEDAKERIERRERKLRIEKRKSISRKQTVPVAPD